MTGFFVFDMPACQFVMSQRPTKSLARFLMYFSVTFKTNMMKIIANPTPAEMLKIVKELGTDLREKSEHYRDQFYLWNASRKVSKLESDKTSFKVGDVVCFKNGYGVPMITEILGFNDKGKAFMLWDCYWFPVNLVDRGAFLVEQ